MHRSRTIIHCLRPRPRILHRRRGHDARDGDGGHPVATGFQPKALFRAMHACIASALPAIQWHCRCTSDHPATLPVHILQAVRFASALPANCPFCRCTFCHFSALSVHFRPVSFLPVHLGYIIRPVYCSPGAPAIAKLVEGAPTITETRKPCSHSALWTVQHAALS